MATISDLTVRLNADRETIQAALDAIQSEWSQLGVLDPVESAEGEIHPDAAGELAERL